MKITTALVGVLLLGSLTACGTAEASPTVVMEGTITDLSFRYGSATCFLNMLKAPSIPRPPAPAQPKTAAPKPAAPVPAKTPARPAASAGGVKAPAVGGAPAQKPVVRPVVKVYHPVIVHPYGSYGYGYTCYRNDCWQVTFRLDNESLARDCVPWSEYIRYNVNDHYPRYRDGG